MCQFFYFPSLCQPGAAERGIGDGNQELYKYHFVLQSQSKKFTSFIANIYLLYHCNDFYLALVKTTSVLNNNSGVALYCAMERLYL